MKRIYLDYAATTPVLKEVLDEMLPYFSENFANPATLYASGKKAKNALEEARHVIADFINAKSDEIVFTSGGTESNNFAIKGLASANKDKNHIITSSIEHHAILEPLKFLKSQGYEITYIPVDCDGLVNPKDIEEAITDKTLLISIMHANNEIGTIQPIEEIGKIAKKHKIYFHTDAVQTLGHIDIDVEKLNVDLLSASSHKIYGPNGVGLLYIRKGVKINPFMHGGEQEFKKRASTHNLAGIVGFKKAIQIAKNEMYSEAKRLTYLRDKLINGILENIEETKLNGHRQKRLPNNVNISLSHIEGESILLSLDMFNIECATGSACTSSTLMSSHVILAIGVPAETAHSSIRFTLGKFTTEEDIDYVLKSLIQVVNNLRLMSPLTN
ncbi:MAG: cysteine desulfurase NifS [Parachlamydiales bacterium]|nr:cysteine desulfurase NifS [Parachlamydiales bacterium]